MARLAGPVGGLNVRGCHRHGWLAPPAMQPCPTGPPWQHAASILSWAASKLGTRARPRSQGC